MYKQCPFIANIFVHGDSLQRFLVAIIVPDFEVLTQWAKSSNLGELAQDLDRLVQSPRVHNLLRDEMAKLARNEGLRGLEQVRRFAVIKEEFTVENDLLTPSMKLKRHNAKIRFKSLIEELYAITESKL